MGKTVLAGFVIAVIAGGLAAADYVLLERPVPVEEPATPQEPVIIGSSASSEPAVLPPGPPDTLPPPPPESSSSAPRVVKKGQSTKKAGSVNVTDVFATLQLVSQQTGEASFLFFTSPDRNAVQTFVLLKNNDRAFLFSSLESDDVKAIFSGLKQALQEQFSGKVTDLVDENRTPEDGPPVDILSFMDPALSSEKIIFLRVRNRLYEIHVAKNGEDVVDRLVEELSK